MSQPEVPRRDFLKLLAGAFSATAIDWDAFPVNHIIHNDDTTYDAVIIGSGLGGLSCAAAFARQGFRPLVLEQHDKPGGYATAFSRPGGFTFDVSLHSTSVGQRDGIYNLIQGFPEISEVEFFLHPTLYRAIFPEHDISVAQRDPGAYIKTLIGHFPEEKDGITGLFEDMKGLTQDIGRLQSARGQFDMNKFPVEFPFLFKFNNKTWGNMVDGRITNPKLKGIVSSQWPYYGLPPSKLSCFYYAMPFLGYLSHGGAYPKGRSQEISNAFSRYITNHGGKVLLNSRVEKIIVKDQTATGVVTADGTSYTGRVIISNANSFDTFRTMMKQKELLAEYESRMQQYSVSLSCFQVFLGLKEDLVGKLGITDSEIFTETGYDPEESYRHMLTANVEDGGVAVTLYDNIYKGYSPAGKNTLNILTLQGYGPWEKYEKDYVAGKKAAYIAEKERMADILIRKAEEQLLPGLSQAIQVREIGTPLTNVRYTGNYRGAIYGWDQTTNNSGATRVGHSTPVKNLYLAGAWSRPGHGYGAVIPSGLECFAEIVKQW
ncbi:MAG: NAD(P)/FAD-dependent oxidoreductase [Bacteroidetes bacterium]|nr:NAD(P)/FAD-dependent oxidoreductase [Bacteroidota bacterium]